MLSSTLIIFLGFFSATICEKLDLIDTEDGDCIACICHAKTVCYDLKECAKHTIDYNYWRIAAPNFAREITPENYKTCMTDDNCILNTIHYYVEELGGDDCYCDGMYECRDKISAHLYRENCISLNESRYEIRFNNCARKRNLQQLNRNIHCINPNDPAFENISWVPISNMEE